MSRIAVGVDAGGTSTVAAFSCDGIFERSAQRGPGNASALGIDGAAAAIVHAIGDVLGGRVPDALYIGAAGAGRSGVSGAIRAAMLERFPAARVEVGDDARIALRAAVPEGPGIVLIAGTGSVAYAEHDGVGYRVGGFGYALGDEGSGFAIGLAALKLLARALDERTSRDETTDFVARALGLLSLDGLLESYYGGHRPAVETIAALAPGILQLAGTGNRAATKIVQAASAELADLVKAIATKARLAGSSPPVVLAGGLLAENSLLTYLLETRIAGDLPGASVIRRPAQAVRGALRLAEAMLAERSNIA